MAERLKPIPLVFWRSASGREPVREWLNAQSREDKRTIGRDIAKAQFGWPMGLPLCRSLGAGLWEVRSSLPSKREARVFIGFHDEMLVVLHAVIKKSRKAAPKELALARERLKELQSWPRKTLILVRASKAGLTSRASARR
jgi:phage-related protein